MLIAFATLSACKTQKDILKPPPPVTEVKPGPPIGGDPKPEAAAEDATVKASAFANVTEKPNYSFANIQFEFNSPILKTASYPAMDKIAAEMKKVTSVKFFLNGYSSSEGTPAHNLSLSQERANAVKSYLTNSGVDEKQLKTKGYGESNPLNSNKTEDEKALNRRVEIKKSK
jgi:OOP family OmpA-OmpF porin